MPLLLRDGGELGRQILRHRHTIDQRVNVEQLAGIVVDHPFEQRVAQSHHRGAVLLALAHQRVERAAGIAARHQAQHLDLAGFGIDFNFNRAPADFPKRALRFERRMVVELGFVVAVAGEFEAGAAERTHHHRCKRMALSAVPGAAHDEAVVERQFGGGAAELLCAERQQLRLHGACCTLHRAAHDGNT